MAAIRSLGVNWPGEIQVSNHPLGCQGKKLSYDAADFFLAYLCGSFGVDKDGDRLSDADDVR